MLLVLIPYILIHLYPEVLRIHYRLSTEFLILLIDEVIIFVLQIILDKLFGFEFESIVDKREEFFKEYF